MPVAFAPGDLPDQKMEHFLRAAVYEKPSREPMISTERLEIRPWSESEAEAFFELSKDEGFNAHPITIYRQPDLATARQWIRLAIEVHGATKMGKWGIWEKQTGTLVGMGGLTPWVFGGENLIDVTYRFRQSSWGKGYGSEAAASMIRYGFEVLGLAEITATITPDNLGSKRIAEKLGMQLNQRIELKGVPTDLYRLRRY